MQGHRRRDYRVGQYNRRYNFPTCSNKNGIKVLAAKPLSSKVRKIPFIQSTHTQKRKNALISADFVSRVRDTTPSSFASTTHVFSP